MSDEIREPEEILVPPPPPFEVRKAPPPLPGVEGEVDVPPPPTQEAPPEVPPTPSNPAAPPVPPTPSGSSLVDELDERLLNDIWSEEHPGYADPENQSPDAYARRRLQIGRQTQEVDEAIEAYEGFAQFMGAYNPYASDTTKYRMGQLSLEGIRKALQLPAEEPNNTMLERWQNARIFNRQNRQLSKMLLQLGKGQITGEEVDAFKESMIETDPYVGGFFEREVLAVQQYGQGIVASIWQKTLTHGGWMALGFGIAGAIAATLLSGGTAAGLTPTALGMTSSAIGTLTATQTGFLSGLSFGGQSARLMGIWEYVRGFTYDGLRNFEDDKGNKLPDKWAWWASGVLAAGDAFIENLQLEAVFQPTGVIKRGIKASATASLLEFMMSSKLMNWVTGLTARGVQLYITEHIEEQMQNLLNMWGKDMVGRISNWLKGTEFDSPNLMTYLMSQWNTFVESNDMITALTILGVPAEVMNTFRTEQQTFRAEKAEGARAEFKEDILKTTPNMDEAQADAVVAKTELVANSQGKQIDRWLKDNVESITNKEVPEAGGILYQLTETHYRYAQQNGFLTADGENVRNALEYLTIVDADLNLRIMNRGGYKDPETTGAMKNTHAVNALMDTAADDKGIEAMINNIRSIEKNLDITILDKDNHLVVSPIESRLKVGEGQTKVEDVEPGTEEAQPIFPMMWRDLTSELLDKMPDDQFLKFQKSMVAAVEDAYAKGQAGDLPKDFNSLFNRSIKSLPKASKGFANWMGSLAIKGSKKTGAALNLSSMCPVFNIGANGCYLDGCYITAMGKSGSVVKLYTRAMYTGEILQLSDENIASLNEAGGLRINGQGDLLDPIHQEQMKDVFRHATQKGLDLKIITKQEDVFRMIAELQGDSDPDTAAAAKKIVVQATVDPYWVPVETDMRRGADPSIAEAIEFYVGVRDSDDSERIDQAFQNLKDAYEKHGRPVEMRGGKPMRKYGFSSAQVKDLADLYPDIRVQLRTVVSTPEEIAQSALHAPWLLQTWFHGRIPDGMWSDVHADYLENTDGWDLNKQHYDKRHELVEEEGEWRLYANDDAGNRLSHSLYAATEEHWKQKYGPDETAKIFRTLNGQSESNASALCCQANASTDACFQCTAFCHEGSYLQGEELQKAAGEAGRKFLFSRSPGKYGYAGAVEIVNDGKAIIHINRQEATISTWIHEMAHLFRRGLDKEQLAALEKWTGITEWTGEKGVMAEEMFADGFIKWLKTAEAPEGMQDTFTAFQGWLNDMWDTIHGKSDIPDEVKRVYASMLGELEQKPAAEYEARKPAVMVEGPVPVTPEEEETRAIFRPEVSEKDLEEGEISEQQLQNMVSLGFRDLGEEKRSRTKLDQNMKLREAERYGVAPEDVPELRNTLDAMGYNTDAVVGEAENEANLAASKELADKWADMIAGFSRKGGFKLPSGPGKLTDMRTHLGRVLAADMKEAMLKLSGAVSLNDIMGFKEGLKAAPATARDQLKKAFTVGKKEGVGFQKIHANIVKLRARVRKETREEANKILKDLQTVYGKVSQMDPAFAAPIKELLDGIELARHQRRTIMRLQGIRDYLESDPNAELPSHILEKLKVLDKTAWEDITMEDARDLHQAVMHYAHLNTKKKQLKVAKAEREFNLARGEAITQMSDPQVIKDMNDRGAIGKGMQFAKNLFGAYQKHYDFLIEEYFGGEGVVYDVAVRQIEDGRDTYIGYKQSKTRWLSKRIDEAEIGHPNKFLQEKTSSELTLRDPISKSTVDRPLTRGEKIAFYMHWMNDDNRESLLKGGVGFRQSEHPDRVMKIDAAQGWSIVMSMTKKELAMVDILHDFYTEQGKEIKPVFQRVNGYEMPTIDWYYHKDSMSIGRAAAQGSEAETKIEELKGQYVRPGVPKGSLKERLGVRTPLYLNDASYDLRQSLEGAALYIGLEEPMRNASKLMFDKDFQQQLFARKDGQNVWGFATEGLRDIAGGARNWDMLEKGARMIAKTRRNFTQAKLGLPNIWVVAKQFLSFPNASVFVPWDKLIESVGQYMVDGKEMTDLTKEMSPLFLDRIEGGYGPDVRDAIEMMEKHEIVPQAKLGKYLFAGVNAADRATVTPIMHASVSYALEAMERGKLTRDMRVATGLTDKDIQGLTPYERMQEAYKFADWVTTRSQLSGRPEHRNPIQRTTKQIWRSFAMFTSATNTNFNLLARTIGDMVKNPVAENFKRMGRALTSVAIVQTLGIMGINAAKGAWREMIGLKRRKTYKEKRETEHVLNVLEQLSGNVMVVREFVGALARRRRWKVGGADFDLTIPIEDLMEKTIETMDGVVNALHPGPFSSPVEREKYRKELLIDGFELAAMIAGVPYDQFSAILRKLLK